MDSPWITSIQKEINKRHQIINKAKNERDLNIFCFFECNSAVKHENCSIKFALLTTHNRCIYDRTIQRTSSPS
jgi:hypothetical protein